MTVAAILKHKGADVARVLPTDRISDVSKLLSDKKIGAVLVLDQAGQVLGIVSERDIVHCLAQKGGTVLEMTAAQLMTSALRTATPATTVQEAMQMMTAGRFRHLPVLDGGKLVGIVSIGDVVKTRIEQQEQEVDSLKAYVAGA